VKKSQRYVQTRHSLLSLVDFFVFFLKAFKQTIETLESYSPSGKWENLQKQVDLRAGDLAHLLKSATTDEGLYILKKLVGFLIDDLEEALSDIVRWSFGRNVITIVQYGKPDHYSRSTRNGIQISKTYIASVHDPDRTAGRKIL